MRVGGGNGVLELRLGVYQGVLSRIDLSLVVEIRLIFRFKINAIAVIYTACYCKIFIFVPFIKLFSNLLFNR